MYELLTIFAVTAWPMILLDPLLREGDHILIPSREPQKGYFNLTRVSPICVGGQNSGLVTR